MARARRRGDPDRAGIEPILQITCRDRNRIALQSDLMGAAALGIRNLLLLTGDDPKAGDQPDTKAVFDIEFDDADRDRARGCATTASCRPAARSPARPHSSSAPPTCRSIRRRAGSPTALAAKVAAGAQFAQTQFCMDTAIVRRYVGRLAETGLTRQARHPGRHHTAALGQVGALDAEAPVRHHHPGRA